jgi:transposase-like protein
MLDHATGAVPEGDFHMGFDTRVRHEFHGSKISSDEGLLLFRELDETLGLYYICSAPSKLDRLKLEFSAKFSWLGEERNRMKASKFTEAQKAFILKQGEQGTPVAEICRKAGISQTTYFNWKKKYGALLPDEMRRLKALEDENTRLKKIVADLTLDREMLQDVIRRKL